MTRPLTITKRQAKALLQAANEEGGVAEVKTDFGVLRLIPAVVIAKEKPVDEEKKGVM